MMKSLSATLARRSVHGARWFFIRLILPWSWRLSRRRRGLSLLQFSRVEADSAWQYQRALGVATDPGLRQYLFANALEEHDHARRFMALAQADLSVPPPHGQRARVPLVCDAGDLRDFLAYVHVSEQSIAEEFRLYRKSAGFEAGAALFQEIQEDEERHHTVALEKLQAHGTGNIEASVGAAWRRRAYDVALQASETLGHFLFGTAFKALYLVFGPIFTFQCAKRLRRRQSQAVLAARWAEGLAKVSAARGRREPTVTGEQVEVSP